MYRCYFYLPVLFFVALSHQSLSQVPLVSVDPVASTGLAGAVDLVNAGDGSNRFFIVQQSGVIRIFSGTALLTTPFLDISADVLDGGEQGLLSLAFSPDYVDNGYF